MIRRLCCSIAATVLIAHGATLAGVVTGGGVFTLSGVRIPGGLLPSLLLVIGDDIVTSEVPAFISLSDHSRLVLREDTHIKLAQGAGHLIIQLISGSLTFHRANGSGLRITTHGQLVEPQAGRDGLAVAEPRKTADQRPITYDRWAPLTILNLLGNSCPPARVDRQCGPGSVF